MTKCNTLHLTKCNTTDVFEIGSILRVNIFIRLLENNVETLKAYAGPDIRHIFM